MQAQLKEEEDRQEREYSAARQYDNEGSVRYRPEDFHFLKVLGKGSFGKVSRFIVLFFQCFQLSDTCTLP